VRRRGVLRATSIGGSEGPKPSGPTESASLERDRDALADTALADTALARRRELRALFTLVLLHVARTEPRGEACPVHSTATVPKSYPGIEMRSMGWPSTRSIVRTMAISSGAMKVNASPLAAARPVRPIRCT